MACRTLDNYTAVVKALPEASQRSRFACACCPDRPGLSLLCWALTPVPHTFFIWGGWVQAWKVRELRRLVAPPRFKVESLVQHCVCNHDVYLLQMRREVEARQARGLPVVPLAATTLMAPAAPRMVS